MTSYLYSGEQTDRTGLQYLRARYYDPTAGRFTRLDPFFGNLEDPLTLHKYLYTVGDPILHTDPSGEIAPLLALGAVLGVFASQLYAAGDALLDGGNAKDAGAAVAAAGAIGFTFLALGLAAPFLLPASAVAFGGIFLLGLGIGIGIGGVYSSLEQGNYPGAAYRAGGLVIGSALSRHMVRASIGKAAAERPDLWTYRQNTLVGDVLRGIPDDAFVHLTPSSAQDFANGVKPAFWARVGDVKNQTIFDFQWATSGPGAQGASRNAKTFVIKLPNTEG